MWQLILNYIALAQLCAVLWGDPVGTPLAGRAAGSRAPSATSFALSTHVHIDTPMRIY